jgi:hypothetical protein
MTKPLHVVAAVFAVSLVCSTAGAQMRGGASAMRMPSVRVAPSVRTTAVAAGIARQVRVLRISPNDPATLSFSTFPHTISFGTTNGVPGLGFDYTHLVAISSGLRNGRTSNFVRGNHRRQSTLVPILIGGYPYYVDSSDYEQPEQQPQVIADQQPAPLSQQVDDSDSAPAASTAPPAAAPVPDVGDFILVRQDGRVLFASAFMVAGAQLTYVTPEGIRRTLPLTDLDADATQQMNEARGTTIQIHN